MPRPFDDHCWKDVVSPEALAIYESYKREIYVGERPALLAIDLYNLVYNGGPRPVAEICNDYPSTCGEYAWAAISPTQLLFKAARDAGIPILYSTGLPQSQAPIKATNRRVKHTDPKAFEIREEFKPEPGDLVIQKQRASVFYGTPIIAYLNQLGVRSLIICGESTSGCVRASAVDAYSNGYHTVVVEECTFDRQLLSHKINLFDLHHKYADVMHVEDVVTHLNGLAGARAGS